MTVFVGAGAISIDVTVARAVVSSVAVKASRPHGVTRMFIGQQTDRVPALAGQVFTLCGFAQSIASRLAVLNAADLSMDADEQAGASAGVLAERIFEALRALVLQWPSPLPMSLATAAGKHLRDALAASRAVIAEAKDGTIGRANLAAAAARLQAAASGLGVAQDGSTPLPGTVCEAIMREAAADQMFTGRSPDPLTARDDAEVMARLCDEPDYAAQPYLFNRVAETGAYARLAAEPSGAASHLVDRLLVRIRDIRSCLWQLITLARTGEYDWASLARGGPAARGGYGAVECARGRLYHQAEIGADGRLTAYRIIAPTEWNFHPAGPFVDTLVSSRIGLDEAAVRSVSRLVALFDPCLAYKIDVREDAHA
ncbi:hydrogenase expression/formation protein HupK (plasmid) [Rhizobium sp. NXC14]|uniref:nickel-dependent hydrogenase large subunit n=1 Tax=Rhizobium sp. NXC14 TaxID=1981173 RepID=UPI000A205044|nr:nickel-dependent hydrogenase large subunit [Rhizobium sp. NXC14]ARO32713.1 hydrogenase expression/formation protein HupK [Rhizobium sp. NXC14]